MDADTGTIVDNITGLKQDHGVAVAGEFNRGFISDGAQGKVIVFDPKTLKVTGEVEADKDADCVIYDPFLEAMFVMDGDPHSSTVIDAKSGSVVGKIDLGGGPEFAVADGKGTVYINLEDKKRTRRYRFQFAKDQIAMAAGSRWSADSSCNGYSAPPALQRRPQSADDGCTRLRHRKGPAVFPHFRGVDAAAYDPETGANFVSTRDSKVHAFHEDSPDKYSEAETITTEYGAKTMGLDTKTHKLFLDTADFGEAPAAAADRPHPQRPAMQGTFHVLVYGR